MLAVACSASERVVLLALCFKAYVCRALRKHDFVSGRLSCVASACGPRHVGVALAGIACSSKAMLPFQARLDARVVPHVVDMRSLHCVVMHDTHIANHWCA